MLAALTSIFGTSHPLDDGGGAHAGADAKRHECGIEVAPLQLVERDSEDHCAGGAERMAHGDGPAVDIDFAVVDAECLHEAQHHRSESFVDLDQVDVAELHAG